MVSPALNKVIITWILGLSRSNFSSLCIFMLATAAGNNCLSEAFPDKQDRRDKAKKVSPAGKNTCQTEEKAVK